MKLSKLTFLILVLLFTTTFIAAQKPKAKATPKATPKAEEPEIIEIDGLFDFLDDEEFMKTGTTASDRKKAEGFYEKGLAFWKTFDISDAIDSFTKALELNAKYTNALKMRGTVYYMTGRHSEAVADFTALLKIEPDNAEILNSRGSALAALAENLLETETDRKKANDTAQKALDDFNKAIGLDAKDADFFNARGKLLFDFDFFKEAIEDFEEAIKLEPKNPFAYTYLGYAKFATGDGMGFSELNKAVEIEPKFADAYFIRGNINRNLGILDKALQDFTKAIELNRYNAKYYNGRGLVYFMQRDGDAAVSDFSKAIDEKRDFGMAYFNRAMTYKKFPYSVSTDENMEPFAKIPLQRKKMMEDFTSAIKHKPNLADAYIERGLMNSTTTGINIDGLDAETIEQLNIALADFEQAVRLDPQSAMAYNGRAGCLDQLGKKELALADYTKAIELDPEMATAYMGRMAIYCEQGKKELSIADEKKIKELGYAAINVCNLGR